MAENSKPALLHKTNTRMLSLKQTPQADRRRLGHHLEQGHLQELAQGHPQSHLQHLQGHRVSTASPFDHCNSNKVFFWCYNGLFWLNNPALSLLVGWILQQTVSKSLHGTSLYTSAHFEEIHVNMAKHLTLFIQFQESFHEVMPQAWIRFHAVYRCLKKRDPY